MIRKPPFKPGGKRTETDGNNTRCTPGNSSRDSKTGNTLAHNVHTLGPQPGISHIPDNPEINDTGAGLLTFTLN